MAVSPITDPDLLNLGTEVILDPGSSPPTVRLVEAGNLDANGVTLQCLLSFLKEEIRTTALLQGLDVILDGSFDEQFEFLNDWEPFDDATRKLLRNGGWSELDGAGLLKQQWAGIQTNGGIDSTAPQTGDFAYYYWASDTAPTVFTYAGPVNEAIQIFGDATHGSIDRRTEELTVAVRPFGKSYDQDTTTAIGVATLTNRLYRFGLDASDADLRVQALATAETGGDVAALLAAITGGVTAPYNDMAIGFYATGQARAGFAQAPGSFSFGKIIEADASVGGGSAGGGGASNLQVYAFVQAELRRNGDINDPNGRMTGESTLTVNGLLSDPLLQFVGETRLETLNGSNPAGGGSGVAIDSYQAAGSTDIFFRENGATQVNFPFVASVTLFFSQTLRDDPNAWFRVFFTSVPSGSFGTTAAVTVLDNGDVEVAGAIGGAAQASFTFDYDGDATGGRTPGTDAPVTAVAGGLAVAKIIQQPGTITRSTTNQIQLTAEQERVYQNAA
ncbi:MAG: hypothetical protein AAF447_08485 [Myxococcota bacterium]